MSSAGSNFSSEEQPVFDHIVIGGGIIGLSIAWQLQQRNPDKSVLLLEKEDAVAQHQSGRNSGVIHAGVYYPPDSLKARLCKAGSAATYAFCQEHGLPVAKTGKLLVATDRSEIERMHALFDRCVQNKLQPEWLTAGELKLKEPAITGVGAFLVRESGITDYPAICRKMLMLFEQAGGAAIFGVTISGIVESPENVLVSSPSRQFTTAHLTVCAGLMADRLARMQGLEIPFRVIPFRGEYYQLRPGLNNLTRHLIYPIPDPGVPFLGVHLTRMIDGSTTVGPNAVQAWKREGYGSFEFSWLDTRQTLTFPGYWKLTARNLRHGLKETWNSLWKPGYLKQVRKYCPQLNLADLHPYRTGIRAQCVLADGTMVDDFLFQTTPRSLHVCNAPSPAATSALPIGEHVCELIARQETESV